jgi:hypothetical protein
MSSVLALALAWGCAPVLSEVSGRVVINGKPAPPGLKVVFEPLGSGAEPILSATDEEGRYRLMDLSGKTGVVAGTYVVSLGFWGDASVNPPELAAIKIPERYRTGGSTLECVVGRTATTFDIDIRTE